MKIKRQKKVGRILSFFKNNYGHRPPFQVLIDGTFTQACLQVLTKVILLKAVFCLIFASVLFQLIFQLIFRFSNFEVLKKPKTLF